VRRISVVGLTTVGLLAVTTTSIGGAHATPKTVQSAIPVLAPWSPPYVERDMPEVVQERGLEAQQALSTEAQAAARLPATKANGCVSSEPGAPLGAPAPRIFPRLLGHHVEVRFEFARLPKSPACRPFVLTVVVYGGQKASSTFKNWVERFRVRGRRGRVALFLPFLAKSPYHVIVNAQTITGHYGPNVERPLSCPGTSSSIAGCLRGYKPELHSYPMPKPVLPLRGLDLRSLSASFAQVLTDEASPPITKAIPKGSRCLSLRLCEVTYVDPAFPRSAYRVRYAIAGQQVEGCWLGLKGERIGEMPYDDAGSGRIFLAGCASWLA